LIKNFSDAFKRWRDINTVEKIGSRNLYTNKERLIKVLEKYIHESKRRQISEVVEKFRLNKTFTEEKKIFLKRLTMKKELEAKIAFRNIKDLSERKNLKK
jgi:hypothetical protein